MPWCKSLILQNRSGFRGYALPPESAITPLGDVPGGVFLFIFVKNVLTHGPRYIE